MPGLHGNHPEKQSKGNAVPSMASTGSVSELAFWPVKSASASFTVEASLIAVTVLMAVFMCIYYGFVLHDEVLLEEAAWQTALRADRWITENSGIEDGSFEWEQLQTKGLLWRFQDHVGDTQRIQSYALSLIQGELMICEIPEFTVTARPDRVEVRYSAKIRFPLSGVFSTDSKIGWLSGRVVVNCIEQEEFIRLMRGILKEEQ